MRVLRIQCGEHRIGSSARIRPPGQHGPQALRFGPARRHVEAASLRPSCSVMTGRETVRTWLCWEDPGFAGEAALPRTRALPGPAGWWRPAWTRDHGAMEVR